MNMITKRKKRKGPIGLHCNKTFHTLGDTMKKRRRQVTELKKNSDNILDEERESKIYKEQLITH